MSDDSTSPDERETVTVEIPLDPAHRRIDAALRANDVPVEQVLAQNLTPQAEKVLHDALQTKKYFEEADSR